MQWGEGRNDDNRWGRAGGLGKKIGQLIASMGLVWREACYHAQKVTTLGKGSGGQVTFKK